MGLLPPTPGTSTVGAQHRLPLEGGALEEERASHGELGGQKRVVVLTLTKFGSEDVRDR